jgi:hypothetical protein
MIKRTDVAGNWLMTDSTRSPGNSQILTVGANGNAAEYASGAGTIWDAVSNGFKIRSSVAQNPEINTSGGTYLYMAFAELPFKYSDAK